MVTVNKRASATSTLVACKQGFGRAGNFLFPFVAIFFLTQRACSQASTLV